MPVRFVGSTEGNDISFFFLLLFLMVLSIESRASHTRKKLMLYPEPSPQPRKCHLNGGLHRQDEAMCLDEFELWITETKPLSAAPPPASDSGLNTIKAYFSLTSLKARARWSVPQTIRTRSPIHWCCSTIGNTHLASELSWAHTSCIEDWGADTARLPRHRAESVTSVHWLGCLRN